MDESGQSTPTPHRPHNSLSWMKGTFAGATLLLGDKQAWFPVACPLEVNPSIH